MRSLVSTAALALLLTVMCPVASTAQTSSGGEFSGLVYSDYYWVAAHHRSELEGANGFRFRRIYLTYDHRFDARWSSRLRLEMDQPGDFDTVTKMSPVVKDAWVAYSPGDHRFELGLTSTPTWGLVEDVWGYRSVERTALDLYGWGSSRDIGLSAEGSVPGSDRLRYHLMFANGSSNRSEADAGKKIMSALRYALSDQLVVQGYLDYEETPGPGSVRTGQLLGAYRTDDLRAGLQWARQWRGVPGERTPVDLVSLFATVRASPTVRLLARLDRVFDPIAEGEAIDYIPFHERAEATFLLAGLDWNPAGPLHLVPNLEAVFYGEPKVGPGDGQPIGGRPETTLLPRVTFFYTF